MKTIPWRKINKRDQMKPVRLHQEVFDKHREKKPFQYLKSCHREEGVNIFSIVPESKTGSNGGKLIRRKANLEIRKLLTMRMINQWNSFFISKAICHPNAIPVKQKKKVS